MPKVEDNLYPHTPDGRYFVVRGRLWRATNPDLAEEVRQHWVLKLMRARRALRQKSDAKGRAAARADVDRAKRALGERGPVWWKDGAPDLNRQMVNHTPYREWYRRVADRIPAGRLRQRGDV